MSRGVINFIILFQGRAGSSFLIDALSSHPAIRADGELLAEMWRPIGDREVRLRDRELRAFRCFWEGDVADRQLSHVDQYYRDAARKFVRAAGFKTKASDVFALKPFKKVLERHSVRVIFMHRKNLVKQAVSRLNASRLVETTGEWNTHSTASRFGTFSVAPDAFDRVLAEVRFDHEILEALRAFLDLPRLDLKYADLLRDQKAWLQSVLTFLDVEPRELQSSVVKNTDDNLRNVLTNYDELRAHYAGTEYGSMFDTE